MKTLKVFGWAVIFTVTLLLAACNSNPPKVAETNLMSGSDETMTQQEDQLYEQEGSPILISQQWLIDNQLYEQEDTPIVISQQWLDERETLLAQDVPDLSRQEEIYAFNQKAWLNERETLLAHDVPDLSRQEEIYAVNQKAWLNERKMRAEEMETDSANVIKLAGVDYSPPLTAPTATRIEAGRCYASVVYPAEYKTVAVVKPVSQPPGDNLPVLYQSVIKKVKVTDEQVRWEEILCEDRMTECRISEVQRALYRGGYNPGPINGVASPQTMAAVKTFQKDFNLSVTNHLTVETVRALDANF